MGAMSVATIRDPEFVNITSISPLVSKCEIKVLYVGHNRNRSYITKETATQMAQTLPGCPIVGYFIENKEDFGDHGDQIIIDGEGVKFKSLTKPYGFVAPDSKVWFQEFQDTDEFGNITIREYLMTEGYLWTQQYKECQRVIDYGNPQSMELDEETLKGHWSTDNNLGVEFFIINDAIFSKLCILGEDVEPCFEGASVNATPAQFKKDDNFTVSLYTMMKELKFALNIDEGGSQMDGTNLQAPEVVEPVVEAPVVEEPVVEEPAPAVEEPVEAPATENFSNDADNSIETAVVENQNNIEDVSTASEFAKQDDEEDKDDDKKDDNDEDDKDDDEEDKDAKYALLQTEFSQLQASYDELKSSYDALVEFKNQVEDQQKDALIQSFSMLDETDKLEVIENKSKYTLDEIEAKLSVLCFRKKVNFNTTEVEENSQAQEPLTYNLNAEIENDSLPAWLKAVEATKNRNK